VVRAWCAFATIAIGCGDGLETACLSDTAVYEAQTAGGCGECFAYRDHTGCVTKTWPARREADGACVCHVEDAPR
jgi:hypothetical protein